MVLVAETFLEKLLTSQTLPTDYIHLKKIATAKYTVAKTSNKHTPKHHFHIKKIFHYSKEISNSLLKVIGPPKLCDKNWANISPTILFTKVSHLWISVCIVFMGYMWNKTQPTIIFEEIYGFKISHKFSIVFLPKHIMKTIDFMLIGKPHHICK